MSSALTNFPLPTSTSEQILMKKAFERSIAEGQRAQNLSFLGGSFALLYFFLILATVILWITAFIDILSRDFKNSSDKIVWLLAVIFVPILGPLAYFFVGRKNKK